MDPISQLTESFKRFPGIGPRQAKRFVYYLLSKDKNFLDSLAGQIRELKTGVKQCAECFRYFDNNRYQPDNKKCRICHDETRDGSSLMVVEKDIDLEAVERAGTFRGYYFVLGGTVPILDKDPESHVRVRDFLRKIDGLANNLKELIIATSASSEGENTADLLKSNLTDRQNKYGFKITLLGRGLSTGSELEYADPETIKNAFSNRK